MAVHSKTLMSAGEAPYVTHNNLANAAQGVLSLSVAGTGTTALTTAQALHAVLIFTGTLTGARTLTCPAVEKCYTLYNNTSGAFSLTFKTPAGTGGAIPQGVHALVYCDGVNVVTLLTGGGSLSGTLSTNKVPYATGASTLGTDTLHWDASNHYLGLNTATPETLLHTVADGDTGGPTFAGHADTVGAVNITGRHARGSVASPLRLQDQDRIVSLSGNGWVRNAADTADGWVRLARVFLQVDGLDAQSRAGGAIVFSTSTGLSMQDVEGMRFTRDDNLLLGTTSGGTAAAKTLTLANSTRPNAGTVPADTVSLAAADLDGVGGQRALYLDTESGVSHAFANEVMLQQLANGQSLRLRSKTELTTIAAAASTDTTITIPAEAQVQVVSTRVTVAIPTATTYTVGIAGATMRYGSGLSTALHTTSKGMADGLRYYPTATAIRLTPDVSPATNAGRVRVTIYYWESIPATS